MGKRTLRIPRSEFAAQLPTMVGKVVQAVMADATTLTGEVLAVEADALVLEDANARWTSRSRHRQRLLLSDIQYIILDVISAW